MPNTMKLLAAALISLGAYAGDGAEARAADSTELVHVTPARIDYRLPG